MTKSSTGTLPGAPWTTDISVPRDYMVTTLTGVGDDKFVAQIHAQLLGKLSPPVLVDWIVNATHMTSFKPSIMGPAQDMLLDFKRRGGRHVIAVIKNPAINMAARAISFGAKTKGGAVIEVVESMPDATRKLGALRAAGDKR